MARDELKMALERVAWIYFSGLGWPPSMRPLTKEQARAWRARLREEFKTAEINRGQSFWL